MFRFSEQSESHAINVAVDFIDKNVTKNAGGKMLIADGVGCCTVIYVVHQSKRFRLKCFEDHSFMDGFVDTLLFIPTLSFSQF